MSVAIDSLLWSLLGGVLIGLSAVLVLIVHGRIAGISGIVGGLVDGTGSDRDWRTAFTLGLVVGGVLLLLFSPASLPAELASSKARLILAGLLVGVGTRIGSGCTSGHGVCGIARLSPRSLAATVSFIASGMLVVAVLRAAGRLWT